MKEKTAQIVNDLMASLPEYDSAYGYGSGFIKQSSYDSDKIKKGLDIIIVANNLEKWHLANFKLNRFVYGEKITEAKLRKIANFQPGVTCFNFKVEEQDIKFTMIAKNNFLNDCNNYNVFTIAGRMQKESVVLKESAEVKEAVDNNRRNALKLALLMNLDQEVTEKELFRDLASLSFHGDLRMIVPGFENASKIDDLVKDVDSFKENYQKFDLYQVNNNKVVVNHKYLDEIKNLNTYPQGIRKPSLEKMMKRLYNKNLYNSTVFAINNLRINGVKSSSKYMQKKMDKAKHAAEKQKVLRK